MFLNINFESNMKYLAAYLLAQLGGTESPDDALIKKIISSVGADVDEKQLKLTVDELKGKNVKELIEEGKSKFASVPSGGAVGGAPAAGGKAEAAKEEEKEEEKEESDDDMGFGLFD
eukprot:NODE_349_length_8994_cov_1.235526.p12 type:complete len:117 gc:universal NODE_349_length_8994_cov_1.235526:6699-7049(+)